MMTSTNPVVCTRGNVQEPQLYHHILGDKFNQITSLMLEATCLWGMSVKIIIAHVGSFITGVYSKSRARQCDNHKPGFGGHSDELL